MGSTSQDTNENRVESNRSNSKRKWRRVHGLEWPLHPQQVVSWLILAYFMIFSYFVIIPTFNTSVHILLYVLHTILYLGHLISHGVAELLDPADPNLRAASGSRNKPVPEFDRKKHAHVIENGRCHLCNITISRYLLSRISLVS